MDFTLVQGIDNMLADIHAEDVNPMRGKRGCGRETDITKTNDTNFLKFHCDSNAFDLEVL